VQLERAAGAHSWLRVVVREGRGREVRRALGHVGADVSRLLRVRFGPFALPPDMRPGESRLVARLPPALLAAWTRFRSQQQQLQPQQREGDAQPDEGPG
jgi:16S rRNA U516 pseudouridylate synthase RsuA-like enzyme